MTTAWSAGKKRMQVKRPALLLSTMLLLQLASCFCQSVQVSSKHATASSALAASHTTLVTCMNSRQLKFRSRTMWRRALGKRYPSTIRYPAKFDIPSSALSSSDQSSSARCKRTCCRGVARGRLSRAHSWQFLTEQSSDRAIRRQLAGLENNF